MVGAVTGLAGYRIELPVPLARKVAPYQRLEAADRAGAVVTGNSDFGAVGSELPRHCRQHQISARKDPRYLRLGRIGRKWVSIWVRLGARVPRAYRES